MGDAPLNLEDSVYINGLYRQMSNRLRRYAKTVLKSDALAEEAVQDTFRIGCSEIKDLRDSDNPYGWLMLVLKNVIDDIERARKRYSRLISKIIMYEKGTPNSAAMEVHVDTTYGDMVQSKEFCLIKRIYLEDHSMAQIAVEDHITIEACKKRTQRAKAFLSKHFEKYR